MSLHTLLKDEDSKKVIEIQPHEKDIQSVLDRYYKQKTIDERLLKEFHSGTYTIDDPLVVINPYEIAPLSALVMFNTNEECVVSLTIKGIERQEDVSHSFLKDGYTNNHIIPVYGLYPEEENKIIIKCCYKNRSERIKEITINTEKLPEIFSKISLITHVNHNTYQEGFNFSYSSIDSIGLKYAFDINGNIRWCFIDSHNMFGATNYNHGKSIYRPVGGYEYGEALIIKESYLGRIEALYYIPNGVHHDANITEDKKLLVTTNNLDTFEDLAVEIDLDSGKTNNVIDYCRLLPRGRRVGTFHLDPRDWSHINAIVSYNGDYISSSNFQSAVFRHTKDNKMKWILSDPQLYPTYWKQYLLKPIGSDFEYPYNQHAVEILPDYDNNPDTVDILLFDNGTSRNNMNKGISLRGSSELNDAKPLYSRMVHYRINEKNMTVEQKWEYGRDRLELYAPTRGDADLLPSGSILGTFTRETGLVDKRRFPYYDTIYVEVDRSGQVIWECYATSKAASNKYLDYRLERQEIYNPDVSYSDLFKETHNFIPAEVMKKYGYEK